MMMDSQGFKKVETDPPVTNLTYEEACRRAYN